MSLTSRISNLKDGFLKRKVLCKDILNISFTKFMKMIDECNIWSIDIAMKTKSQNKMNFFVIPSSVNGLFWRIRARIEFKKLDIESGNIIKVRLLKLHQFLLLHQQIQLIIYMNEYDNIGLQYSMLVTRVDVNNIRRLSTSSDTLTTESTECSICLNQPLDVILPCGHGYCSKCTKEWSNSSSNMNFSASNWEVLQVANHYCWPNIHSNTSTVESDSMISHVYNGGKFSCPECRIECSSDSELWNMLDRPKSGDCNSEMNKALENLIENLNCKRK